MVGKEGNALLLRRQFNAGIHVSHRQAGQHLGQVEKIAGAVEIEPLGKSLPVLVTGRQLLLHQHDAGYAFIIADKVAYEPFMPDHPSFRGFDLILCCQLIGEPVLFPGNGRIHAPCKIGIVQMSHQVGAAEGHGSLMEIVGTEGTGFFRYL